MGPKLLSREYSFEENYKEEEKEVILNEKKEEIHGMEEKKQMGEKDVSLKEEKGIYQIPKYNIEMAENEKKEIEEKIPETLVITDDQKKK